MILDALSCLAQENAPQAYHIHKEAEHGDSGRAYLSSRAAGHHYDGWRDHASARTRWIWSAIAELMVRLVTDDQRIKRIVDASEESATIVRSLCQSRTISSSNLHGIFPFASASGFALSKCPQPNFVVSHLSHGTFEWQQMCPYLQRQSLLISDLIVWSPTSLVRAPALVSQRMRRSTIFEVFAIDRGDRTNPNSYEWDVPYGFTYHEDTRGFHDQTCRDGTDFQHPHCTYVKSRDMQLQDQMFPILRDLGHQMNRLTAPQYSVPWTRINWCSILPQAPTMNMHEVPSYYNSNVKKTTLGYELDQEHLGSPTYQLTHPSGFSAKQVEIRQTVIRDERSNARTWWPGVSIISLRSLWSIVPQQNRCHCSPVQDT